MLASSFVCCCRLRDCPQVQYSLALGYSRARIRRRTVHFWRSAYSVLDCFAATSLVAFLLATLILGLSGPRPLQRLPCVVVGYSSLGAWPLPRFADPSLWFPRARLLFNTDFLAFILSVCMCVCSVIIHRYSNPSALGRSSARLLRFSATACARPIRHHSPLALGVPLRSAAPAPDRSVGGGPHRGTAAARRLRHLLPSCAQSLQCRASAWIPSAFVTSLRSALRNALWCCTILVQHSASSGA